MDDILPFVSSDSRELCHVSKGQERELPYCKIGDRNIICLWCCWVSYKDYLCHALEEEGVPWGNLHFFHLDLHLLMVHPESSAKQQPLNI